MNELVKMENGIPVASSRDIAKRFGKDHKSVMYAIDGRACTCNGTGCKKCKDRGYQQLGLFQEVGATSHLSSMFIPVEYIDKSNRVQKEYLMTRDGFSLLVMGFTGTEALKWKLKYIEAFNKMETYIKQIDSKSNLLLQIYNGGQEGILAAKKLVELEKKPLLDKIEEDRPLRDFAEHVTQSSDTIDMGELAKLAKKENINIGRNRLFKYLRENKIVMNDNTPYQKYIENKWFEVIEVIKHTPYGEKLFLKTLVTGKGQLGVIEMLRRDFCNAE